MRAVVRLFLMVALLLAGGFLVFASSLPKASAPIQAFDDTPRSTIGIVVLTGGGGKRIERGLELYEEGWADRVLISGTHPDVRKADLAERFDTTSIECCVDLGPRAQTTIGNAIEARDWVTENGYTAIYLVTDNYHLPRAMVEMRAAIDDVEIRGVPVDGRIDPANWYGSPGNWNLLGREYIKFLLATLRSIV